MTDSISPRHLRSKPLHREIELDFIRGIAILMVVDFGRRVETALLIDRLVATVAGAVIVVGLNVALDALTRLGAPKAA